MNISSKATLGGSSHHVLKLNGTRLHYVSAGSRGSPILLVHGFPETWWTFHKLIPLLAANHRVFAVDLRGFGDSDSRTLAEDLHQLIAKLDVGPVHLSAQDVSGAVVFKLSMPVLAIGAGGGPFTAHTLAQVAAREIRAVTLAGVGHYAALEAPDRVAQAMLDHIGNVDSARIDALDAHDREQALRLPPSE